MGDEPNSIPTDSPMPVQTSQLTGLSHLQTLAAQIDSAISAVSNIQGFAGFVQPVHDSLVALANSASQPTDRSASDLYPLDYGLNGAYEDIRYMPSNPVAHPVSIPQIPDLPTLKILATQIDADLQASTGTQGFTGVADSIHDELIALAASIPEPTSRSASDLEEHEHGESGSYQTESKNIAN